MKQSIDLMFHVASPNALSILSGLCNAAQRNGCSWAVFLTSKAVTLATEPTLQTAFNAADRVVVCESSWEEFGSAASCPVESGSQTSNSEMVSRAMHVVSL